MQIPTDLCLVDSNGVMDFCLIGHRFEFFTTLIIQIGRDMIYMLKKDYRIG